MPNESSLKEMRHLLCGFATTAAVSAVVNLGIIDHLSSNPRTTSELARLTGTNEEFLRRVLRYLASEGVFSEQEGDVFALTDLSYWLQSGLTGSLQPRASFVGRTVSWTAWGKLIQCLKTGESGVRAAFGHTLFEFAKSDPDTAAIFDTYMAAQTKASVEAVLNAYNFAGVRELVDVGGGRGALLAGILQAHPGVRGILFDLPEVTDAAYPLLERAGVSDRCKIVSGSFFDQVLPAADAYAIKFILHDWSDDDSIRILSNCRRAMTAGGRVLIIEHVMPEQSVPDFARFMDMNMLVLTEGGRERTKQEFSQLLAAADLELRTVTPTAIGLWVLEGVARQ